MEGAKFIKAYCNKQRRYFGLEIKKFGDEWKVVNFIALTDAESAVLNSEIKQSSFTTADTLLPCRSCGGRTVGGCKCALPCKVKSGEYNFGCIYCSNLSIDYSAPKGTGQHKEGDTVILSQGHEITICTARNPLKRLLIGTGWDPVRRGCNLDLDSSVVVVNENTGATDVVYFGALEHSSGCVIHHGDNLTGEYEGYNDDETIDVFLDKVPRDKNKLVFILNVYDCDDRNQTLEDAKNMYIRLYDVDGGKVLAEYTVNENHKKCTALIIGVAKRVADNEWTFKAVGKGSTAVSIYDMLDDCIRA